MSREILFKAKRKNWRELPEEAWWVEGYYVYFKKMKNACMYHTYKGAPLVTDVDAETVCQYAGLTDKNVRKIFEGDIVCIDGQDEQFIVAWDSDTSRFVMNSGTLIVDFDNYWNYQVEVISNIFDNSELLEEGTK